MPKLTGVFEELFELDKLPIDEINRWLVEKEHEYVLENFLGNRILYPQTIPMTKRDMEIDLAILSAYMHIHPDFYYNVGLNRIIIPEKVEWRFPPLANLVFYFPEIFNLTEVVELAIKMESGQVIIVGTIVSPQAEKLDKVKINGQLVKLDPHGMTYFETDKISNEIELPKATVTVAGGKLGIIINQKQETKK
jgi:hypothetical protein